MEGKRWFQRLALVGFLVLGFSACGEEKTPWDSHMEKGEQFLQEQKYEQAETELQAAVLEAELLEEPIPRLAQSLRTLAILYDIQGDYAKAEPLLKRVIAIYEKGGGFEPFSISDQSK